ncbi:MAG TPA: beta-ketoacyl-ACP synthase III [Candidatus Solibacter sp.]|nr:beta-ketoacyl-ACP synthase III [Candidatus Solibacter sp.]
MRLLQAKISGLGVYAPPEIRANDYFERTVNVSDEWIVRRTGIRERRICRPGTPSSELAALAGRRVIEDLGISPAEVDVVIVATATPDMIFPATACLVQHKLECRRAWGFDISAACSGFLFGMQAAVQFIRTGALQRALVIGVDVMSSITDYSDPSTCILFGDGAGAVLIEPADERDDCVLIDFLHEGDGSLAGSLRIPGGGSLHPASHETVSKKMHFVHQDGVSVFKYSVCKLAELCQRLLARNNLTINDIKLFVPHQGNRRIMAAVAERLNLCSSHVIVNIDKYGNTGAATIPLALQSAMNEQRLNRGDIVLLAAVGAGMTAGATLLRWSY